MEIAQRQMLDIAYNQVTTVWNFGSNEQRVLASQIMDDINKLLKFGKRYKAENFIRKFDELINGAKELCTEYQHYKQQQSIADYGVFVAEYDAPEIKEEVIVPPANDLLENKSNVTEVVKMEEMNNAPKSKRGGKRKDAGRKSTMEKPVVRKVSITLPQEEWDWIDELLKPNEHRDQISLAKYFHDLAIFYRDDFTPGKI